MKASANVLLVRGKESFESVLRWSRSLVGPHELYAMELDWNGGVMRGEGPDMFEALIEIRRQLELEGWLIAVQGSRYNTYPSGMARDMGGGERIYVLRPECNASFQDLVDTLAPAEPSLLATVETQKEYWLQWLQDRP